MSFCPLRPMRTAHPLKPLRQRQLRRSELRSLVSLLRRYDVPSSSLTFLGAAEHEQRTASFADPEDPDHCAGLFRLF